MVKGGRVMINIVLSCSQQSWNKCAMGDTEEDHTYSIAKKTGELLQDYKCNVLVISKDITGTETETLNQVVTASNAFASSHEGQAFHLDIHTDGGYQGAGVSGFYYPNSENGKDFISLIHKEVSAMTPWADGAVSPRVLFVLAKTQATAGLIELSFHDVYAQAKHIHENADLYAQAIVRGLVRACGLEKKKAEVKKTSYKDDDKISIWAKDAITNVTSQGIMRGDENGNFRPKDYPTREELAVVANNLLNQK